MPLNLAKRKFRTFAPDADPLDDGVLVDGNNFVPTQMGMRTLPQLRQLTSALTQPCLGSAVVTFADGEQFVVAGTENFLCNIATSAFDPTGVVPFGEQDLGAVLIPPTRWRFAQYQERVFAVDGVRPPFQADQASLATANPWTPVPDNPPISALVASSDFSLFLVEANPNAITGGASATWWSSLNSQIWASGSVQTETVHSSITQTPGPITAAKALRSAMVLYKRSSMFVGQLVGPPFIWSFTEVSRIRGALSQESVVCVDDVHYFLSGTDWYSFDGYSLSPLPNQHREWFFRNIGSIEEPYILGRYDSARTCIFWHFAPLNASNPLQPREWVALNPRTGQWTRGYKRIESTPSGIDPNTITEPFGVTSVLFLDDNTMWAYDRTGQGADLPAYFTTGDIGDRHFMYQLSRVRPAFTVVNGTPNLNIQSSYTPGAAYTTGPTIPLSADGWWNVLSSARLQRLQVSVEDDVEIAADNELQLSQVGDY